MPNLETHGCSHFVVADSDPTGIILPLIRDTQVLAEETLSICHTCLQVRLAVDGNRQGTTAAAQPARVASAPKPQSIQQQPPGDIPAAQEASQAASQQVPPQNMPTPFPIHPHYQRREQQLQQQREQLQQQQQNQQLQHPQDQQQQQQQHMLQVAQYTHQAPDGILRFQQYRPEMLHQLQQQHQQQQMQQHRMDAAMHQYQQHPDSLMHYQHPAGMEAAQQQQQMRNMPPILVPGMNPQVQSSGPRGAGFYPPQGHSEVHPSQPPLGLPLNYPQV